MMTEAVERLNDEDDPATEGAQLFRKTVLPRRRVASEGWRLTAAATIVQSSRPAALTIPSRT